MAAAEAGRGAAAKQGAHIWWGSIASERQAREIVAWAAWSLIIIGLAPAAALVISAIHGDIRIAAPFYANLGDNRFVLGQASFLAVELTAAALLLRKRYWAAALVLFVCCVFVIAVVLATMLRLGRGGGAFGLYTDIQDLLLVVCLLFFTRLVWRALEATAALRKLRMLEVFT